MARPTHLREEAIQLYDSGDSRSFNEIYKGREDLFENVDDLIDPKFRKLFESIYDESGNLRPAPKKRLREADVKYGGNQWTGGLDNKNDGVPAGHNPPLSKGATSQVTQSGQDYDTNPKLFEKIFREANGIPPGGHYDSGKSAGPKPDGVPNGHNPKLSKGATSQVTQSDQDYSSNPALFDK